MKNKKTNYNYIFIFIIIIFIIIIFLSYYNDKNNKIPNIKIINMDIPDVKWPFINLKDENGKNINMLCIRGYLEHNADNTKQFLEYINKGIKFIGCSSHLSFPRICDNSHAGCNLDKNIKIFRKDIEDYVLGWCHCFKEPDKYIKGNIPKILISESDFNSENLEFKHLEKKYDYIIIQPKDNECKLTWNSYNKNWLVAEECIKIFSDELNLKGLIVGREGCPINIKNKNNVEMTGILSKELFIDKIRESKFMLLPNLEDASPRVLTESLAVNTPIFVYENILGGWKYVNDKTGIFFDENNIKQQAQILLKNINDNNYDPRNNYLNNYGLKNSGKQLRDFLKSIYPDLSPCKYVRFNTS
jgi:glycosyltransferase involved in cell wall biosynthesis